MRALLLTLVALPLAAQQPALTRQDSTLVGRMLLAEDRRDTTDVAIADGLKHGDARIRVLAHRAVGRARDAKFTARDSLPALPAPPSYTDPAWRLRFRALTAERENCGALRTAMSDSAWAVRLRASDLIPASCAGDTAIVATLRRWVDALPPDASRRIRGGASFQPAGHGIVALAKLDPAQARARAVRLARHSQWQVRMYAARALALMSDTVRLRVLSRDADDNVKETAIQALARITKHADDTIYVRVVRSNAGAQAVRAAAIALEGSSNPDARTAANAAFDRWVARNIASARDVRVALLAAAGRQASDDRPPSIRVELPPRAVALALGQDVRLRVTMSPRSGGGTFVVRLRGDVAPMMASRILSLAARGYYNGLTWHRVEGDFVIQGGSPGANEYVGLAQFLRDELGTVPHVRGTVGMSTRGHDTGDAQWFVNLRDNLRLNTDYTVFAEVIDGIDVVDGILEGDVIARIDEVRGPAL